MASLRMIWPFRILALTTFDMAEQLIHSTGIVYAGAGVGGAVFALITSALIKRFDVPWAFRILGLIFLSINLPCAWVLKSRSPKVPLRRKEGEEKAKLVDGLVAIRKRFADITDRHESTGHSSTIRASSCCSSVELSHSSRCSCESHSSHFSNPCSE